jgi:hypothetical protein
MNMRTLTPCLMIATLVALGCGGAPEPDADGADSSAAHGEMPADAVHGMPDDDAHASAMGGAMGGSMHSGGGINAEITLDPAIADDWRAVRVKVVDLSTLAESSYEVPIGGSSALGASGLTLEVVSFIPDFVMSEDGITSRSAEPQNPAARVVISEAGKDDFTGWLFAAMPEIHPFQHPTYGVVLVEGIPAE